jgi:gas vesicle protein
MSHSPLIRRTSAPRTGALSLALSLALGGAALLPGCRSSYYSVMEQFGVHKRDILVDRVEEGRDAQQEAKKEFQSALAAFQAATGSHGGKLQDLYERLNDHYESSAERVETVRTKIKDIEKVAGDLFSEWKKEIGEIQNADLKAKSEKTLSETRGRYKDLIAAMQRAEKKMEPVLVSFHDHVLFLKHNLNAQAIASLQTNLGAIETDVAGLVREMEKSIAEADEFLKDMRT